jgi:hypothetical protein
LGLSGDLSIEWRHFCRDLQVAGVILSEEEDKLFWIGGDSSGVISVKNFYEAIQTTQNHPWVTGWKIHLWKWDIPQKIKLSFGWQLTIKFRLGKISFIGAGVDQEDVSYVKRSRRTLLICS